MQKTDKGKNKIHIKDWPEGDRPREMLLNKGPEALSDAALLAILLRTGRQGQNAIALAREMKVKFGGVNGLMSTTSEDLLDVKGIVKAKVAQILAAMEIDKRQLLQPLGQINIVEIPRHLFEYLQPYCFLFADKCSNLEAEVLNWITNVRLFFQMPGY